MAKLLKTNTVIKNIELVKSCGTQEEMIELLATATKEMLIAINYEVNGIHQDALIRRMRKQDVALAIAYNIMRKSRRK